MVNKNSASKKSGKPLPLLPHEEREVLPRGKPVDPQIILADHVNTGRQARVWIWIFGGKSGALINNYFRMNHTILAIIFLALYVLLIVAWFPAFGIGFILVQRLLQTGSTHFPALILCLSVIIILPFSPNIIAWVQQEHYQQWVENFSNTRRDYLDRKG